MAFMLKKKYYRNRNRKGHVRVQVFTNDNVPVVR